MGFYLKIYKHRVLEHRLLKCSEWLTCLLSWAILCSVENWESKTPGAYAGGVLIKSWIVSSIYLTATIIGYFELCNNVDTKSSENKFIKSINSKIEWLLNFIKSHGPKLTLRQWVDWTSAFFDFALDLAATVLIHFMIFDSDYNGLYKKRLITSAAFGYTTSLLWLIDLILLVCEIKFEKKMEKKGKEITTAKNEEEGNVNKDCEEE